MAVEPRIECFSRDLIPEYWHGLGSSTVYTALPVFVKSLPGRSNRCLLRLPLHMHAEEIVPALLTSNIYIGLCLPKALTVTRHRSYKTFEVFPIVTIDQSVGLGGILDFPLLGGLFPYRLARGIPLKEGVPWPLQSKVRTPPPHLRWTILAWKISLKA